MEVTFSSILEILVALLSISLLISFMRLYIGPDVPNRTVAFDLIAIHAVGILALFAVRIDSAALLDVAIVTAVLGFLGTTMLARYLERSQGQERSEPRRSPRATARTAADTPTRAQHRSRRR